MAYRYGRNGVFPAVHWEGEDVVGSDGIFPIGVGESAPKPGPTPGPTPSPIPPYGRFLTEIIWVSKQGNDITGTGSQQEPYLTVDRALLDFRQGSQIRILEGTYTPEDTVSLDGYQGSIFAEVPNSVVIKPQKTTRYGACIAVTNSPCFFIQGINVVQSTVTTNNFIGIYADGVKKFVAKTCNVSTFEIPSGHAAAGIYARGEGRIEDCTIEDISGSYSSEIYGIQSRGLEVVECTVRRLTNRKSDGTVQGILRRPDSNPGIGTEGGPGSDISLEGS